MSRLSWLLMICAALSFAVGCPDPDDDTTGDDDTTEGDDEDDDGWTVDQGDCDDNDPTVHPDADEGCDGIDTDCDGELGPEETDDDGDGVTECDGDCDDDDASLYPGADEDCDGLDTDCDGELGDDETDDDGDGASECDGDCDDDDALANIDDADGDGQTSCDGDCDDTNADVHDGAAEICDGLDNDCDGSPAAGEVDNDGDGYLLCLDDCDDSNAEVYPGADEICDGEDSDCDGVLPDDEADLDGDGYLACLDDCNDDDGAIYPGAAELCDGIDNDCDGSITGDETDDDGDGQAECDGDCDDTAVDIFDGAPELCDGIDNDCDGAVPPIETDDDGDGQAECDGDCDDTDPLVFDGANEVCNGIDDDCDGVLPIPEVDADGDGTAICEGDCDDSDPDLNGEDDDGDGQDTCHGDCDDANPNVFFGAPELCDGVDDDCDGNIPGDELDDDGDGQAECEGDCDDADADIFLGATEVCNGVDDDCDGIIPPEETDDDGDGWTECVGDCDDTDADVYPGAPEDWYDGIDADCDGFDDPDPCDDPPPEHEGPLDPTCEYAPPVGSFNPVTEWGMTSFVDFPDHLGNIATPVVGQMTDDDGDGQITAEDTPDILLSFRDYSGTDGVLRLISGDGSAVHWSIQEVTPGYDVYRYAGTAIADLDADGWPEILVMSTNGSTCYLTCLEHDGSFRWMDTANGHGLRGHFPSVADLDGDGTPEIVVGAYIYNIDGSVRGVGSYGSGYYSGYGNSGYTSFGMDMDGDGQLEVVAGDALYDADGNTVCNTGYPDGQPGAADLDLDGEGEFVTVSGGSVYVFDTNCDYLTSWSIYGGGNGGPPTIADYDGDGVPEIGLPGDDYYTVYETDGTILWSNAVQDHSSNSTGSSVFDFDGDGQAEVVYADETRLWIYDGATGAVLLEYDDHHSGTVNEYPIIVDVDADGRAEIVVGNDGGTGDDSYKGLRVIGDAEDNWVTVRQVWNQHAYHISNVNDDLTIPTPSEPNWPQFNTFRQAGIGSIPATSAPDLWPEIVDVCQPDCGLEVTVVVQVVNGGALMAAAGVGVSLYAEDAQGVRTLLDWTTTAADVDAGMISDSLLLIATAADLGAATSVVVAVDDNGAGLGSLNECDEDNEIDVDVSGICL